MQPGNDTKLTLVAIFVFIISLVISLTLLALVVAVALTPLKPITHTYPLPVNQLEIDKANLEAYENIPGPGEYK